MPGTLKLTEVVFTSPSDAVVSTEFDVIDKGGFCALLTSWLQPTVKTMASSTEVLTIMVGSLLEIDFLVVSGWCE